MRLVCDLLTRNPASRLTIMAHSMGSYVTVNALDQLNAQTCPATRPLNDVIFFSPDIPIDLLRNREENPFARALSATAYVSANDDALRASETVWNIDSFGRVHRGQPFVVEGFRSIDVSAVQPSGFDPKTLGHDSYNYTLVLDDVFQLLRTGEVDPDERNRRNSEVYRPDGGVYLKMAGVTRGR